ncbi:MAG: hypothetical protein JW981_04015 [Anaerolineae bacterium]|nr:hypothetical protein [Anaerolineae bacterium]
MLRNIVRFLITVLALVVLNGCSGAVEPWNEPFDTVGDWQLESDASASVEITGGRLLINILVPGQIAWASIEERPLSDFRLTVEAAQEAGPMDNEYGVLLRMEDDVRFYAFSVSGDGYVRIALYENEQWTLLGQDWTASDAVHQGMATNVLGVDANGEQLTFSVNGEVVAQLSDATLTKGGIGLYAGAFNEAGVEVAFDNLQIEPLP